jgi:hypothetical protein
MIRSPRPSTHPGVLTTRTFKGGEEGEGEREEEIEKVGVAEKCVE